jgi:streptomycin 6-kinase
VTDGADLRALADTASVVARDWGLELGEPFALSRFSYVAPVGPDVVLKVTPVDDDEADEEADALAFWNGDGAVRMLKHDRVRRAALIERAQPGTDISRLPEDEATAIAVSIGLRLWRPAGEPFRWIGDHVPRWLDNAERAGAGELVARARDLYASLEVGRATLIHGDFHHHNLLDAGGRYVAIDPKPMLGEPEYDVPSFLWNPYFSRMSLDVAERRIVAFVAAGLDEQRIRAWTVIRGAYLRPDDADVTAVVQALGRGL